MLPPSPDDSRFAPTGVPDSAYPARRGSGARHSFLAAAVDQRDVQAAGRRVGATSPTSLELSGERVGVLIVDDEPQVRRLITLMLERQGYVCEGAADVREARALLADDPLRFKLVLCDMNMPGENGLELVRHVLDAYPGIAALMVTGTDDPEIAQIAIKLGAYGYVTKPFSANELLINVANALHRRRLELENRLQRDMLEQHVEARTAALQEALEQLRASEQELRTHHEETIRRLSSAAELRDHETGGHIDRMSRYCALVARRLGLPNDRIELVRIASPMHDIGKIAIPDRILLKPGTFTADERRLMQTHTEIGYAILAGSHAELLRLAATLAWTHHERFDGSGYPRGLVGDEIPLEGRIAALADVFDALTSDRVYRAAYPLEEATTMMQAERGGHFDPTLLDLFLDSIDEVEEIRRSQPDAATLLTRQAALAGGGRGAA
jgi:putative two-component system response regulator